MKVSVSKIALNLKQAIAASHTFENDFEVLRRCFREFLRQFRFAIAAPVDNNRDMKRQHFFR